MKKFKKLYILFLFQFKKFNVKLIFKYNQNVSKLRFELWDKNKIGFDEFLGEINKIDVKLNIKYP